MLQNNPVLKSKIDQLWNKFWSGGISNPLTAIEQITYLLFMKRLDDLDLKRKADAEFTGESYTSKFEGYWIPPEHVFKPDEKMSKEEAEIEKEEREKPYRVDKETLRWSHFKRMSAEEMLTHVQMKVFPFLKSLNGDESPFTHHMKNAVFIIPKPALLVEAMSTIEEIFAEIEKDANEGGQAFQDIQGDVYEMLLSEIATSGKNGQFRTPRHIIKLIAELVEPQLGNKIADPACGTGGFLLGAYQYLVTQLDKNKKNLTPDEDGFIRNSISGLLTREVNDILNDSLYGYDIDVTMVRLGLMNLMMHGVDTPHIDYKDTLSKGFAESNQYHVIMANPPFTGSIDKGDINESLTLGTTKTELLFIENIYNLLKMGGTAGVIVPQGVLFGSGNAFVEARKILVEKCELKAVITMPSGVFKPYAGVSTAILIFTKGGETENVWFYEMQSDGYGLDDKRNKLEGYGDLQDIVTQYKKRDGSKESDRKEKFFFVRKEEIVAEGYDLSMSKYKEDVFKEVVYEKPSVILSKLKNMESEINKGLTELEVMLR
ncbi:N-6 DNA methylase [Clostridium sp.]|uniref:type I restriction-modification system subunit M n=1 Tax=Clostridium sp. TaxID=1506 RepID=UPI002FC8B0A4